MTREQEKEIIKKAIYIFDKITNYNYENCDDFEQLLFTIYNNLQEEYKTN